MNSCVLALLWDLRGVYLRTYGKLYQDQDLQSRFGGDSMVRFGGDQDLHASTFLHVI